MSQVAPRGPVDPSAEAPPADRLESRLEFETLISDTSAALFASAAGDLDRTVEHALGRVRIFFRADRCALLAVSADGQTVSVRVASYGEEIPQVPAGINLARMFPWLHRTLLAQRWPVRVARIDDLPPEAEAERDSWIQLPVRAALVIPIETGGIVSHLIVLNAVHQDRDWPDVLVTRLRVLGQMVVGALERQAIFTELREAEARVSLAADAADAGLWVLDHGTGVFWLSERARALFGYSPDAAVDVERLMASVHPDDRDLVGRAIERSVRLGESVAVEYRILTGGRVRWIASRGRSQSGSDGAAMRLTGVSTDVTDRRYAEEALRKSETRLSSAAELAELAFYEVRFDERVAFVDERFRDICGLGSKPLQGLEPVELWKEHLHPDDRRRVLDARRKLHDGNPDRVSIEYRYVHPVRGQRWIQHLARVAVRDADGRAIVAFGVLRDITEVKSAEVELRDLSQRLIRAHEEQRAILARELHDDLTQRLAVLAIDVGRAEIAAPVGAPAETLRAVRDGLARLSEDVHSLAYQLHPSVLDDLGLGEALRAECERIGRQGVLKLSVQLHPVLPAVPRDTALCLFRVAQEALSNVVRHAGARSAGVVLQEMDGGLLLAVRDDGIGFDPGAAQQRRRLGFASMRERLQLVHGTLDIESAPGGGTTVVAWAPLGAAS